MLPPAPPEPPESPDEIPPQEDTTDYPTDASAKDLEPVEAERLTRQEQAVFDLLSTGREVCNTELAEISLKYFTKVSSLRAKGYDIQLVREEHDTGLAWYVLTSPLPKLRAYAVPVEIRIPGEDPQQRVLKVLAISALSARYRAWRAVKVIALAAPEELVRG